jgi:hypothetical protein
MVLSFWAIPYRCSLRPDPNELLERLKLLEISPQKLVNRKDTYSGFILSKAKEFEKLGLVIPFISNEFGPKQETLGSIAREVGIIPETMERATTRVSYFLYTEQPTFVIPVADHRYIEFADVIVKQASSRLAPIVLAPYAPSGKFIDDMISERRPEKLIRWLRLEWPDTGKQLTLNDIDLLHEIVNVLPFGFEHARASAVSFNYTGASGLTFASVSHNTPPRHSARKEPYVLIHTRLTDKKRGTVEALTALKEVLDSVTRAGTIAGVQPQLDSFVLNRS